MPSKKVKPPHAKPPARTRYACQLPVPLASRLEALCDMHPEKTRSQVMADVIGLGLAEIERVAAGAVVAVASFHPDTRQSIYLLTGPFSEFHGLTSKHHLAIERKSTPGDADEKAPIDDYSLGDME
jgi:hypothetical protein